MKIVFTVPHFSTNKMHKTLASLQLIFSEVTFFVLWAVVVVKWSACLPSTPMIQVGILLLDG